MDNISKFRFYLETIMRIPSLRTPVAIRLSAFFAVALFLLAAIGNAQISGTGSIQGTVADSTGASVPNALVTITNTATQVKRTINSGRDGLFSFPNIDIGTYDMTVTAGGFKTYDQKGIILEVGSSLGFNVSLTVGATTEQVEVQATGIALQTEDVSFKQTIDQRSIYRASKAAG